MAKDRIPRTYNIPEGMMRAADELGLDAMATGGGVDYIFAKIGKNQDGSSRYALIARTDGHGGPTSPGKRCEVVVTLNEDWTDTIAFPYATAREGMAAAKTMIDSQR